MSQAELESRRVAYQEARDLSDPLRRAEADIVLYLADGGDPLDPQFTELMALTSAARLTAMTKGKRL